MKISLVFLLYFSLLTFVKCRKFTRSKNNLSSAVKEVVEEFLIKTQILDFEILVNCKLMKEKWKLDEILKTLRSENYAVEVKFKKNFETHEKLGKSSIILFCSNDELNNFSYLTTIYSPYPKLIKLIIFSLEVMKFYRNPKDKRMSHQHPLHHAYFIENNRKSLEFFTFEQNTKFRCNFWQKILLNNFDKKSQKWTKNLKNYEKFKNFHNCLRVFLIEYGTQIYIRSQGTLSTDEISERISKGDQIYSNTIDIIKIVAEKANIKPFIQILHFEFDNKTGGIFRPIFINGTALYDHEVFYTGSYEHYNGGFHVATSAYHQPKMIFLVTPGEPFTPYEKLLLPFDAQTWIFLVTTLIVAFVVIFITNLLPKVIQMLLYGTNVNSPTLNVLAVFFGISQTKLPFSSFGRIILTTFLMFCMVLRNGYQGNFFSLIESFLKHSNFSGCCKKCAQIFYNFQSYLQKLFRFKFKQF